MLFEGDYFLDYNLGGSSYDIMSDGKHFVMIRTEQEFKITQINVVLNWFERTQAAGADGVNLPAVCPLEWTQCALNFRYMG